MAPPRRKRSTLRGTNLYVDPRTGNYIWRRVHELTGKRLLRSTRTTHLTVALQRATEFEDDYQREVAGLNKYDGWKLDARPLIATWLSDVRASPATVEKYRRQVESAFTRLGVTRLSDLDDVPRLDRELTRLGARPVTAVRTIQKPMKQFSRWLLAKRYVDHDPLAGWRLREIPRESKRPRRALRPDEVARALLAADWLDRNLERDHPQRLLYLTLLVSAARVGSVLALDVAHLDREAKRLNLGPDVRNKRKGAAALDDATLAELVADSDDREDSEPLLPSPRGGRSRVENVLDDWRQCVGIGIVAELSPNTPIEICARAAHYLATGSLAEAGNPTLPSARRDARTELVRALAGQVEAEWRARMIGIDVHALKVTHRTWGEVAGIHPLVLDKQCGHQTAGGAAALEAARAIVNPIGRKHYVDVSLEMIDPRRAAEAVRQLLDRATEQVREAACWHTEWHTEPTNRKSQRS